jgi:hypothetical protein
MEKIFSRGLSNKALPNYVSGSNCCQNIKQTKISKIMYYVHMANLYCIMKIE